MKCCQYCLSDCFNITDAVLKKCPFMKHRLSAVWYKCTAFAIDLHFLKKKCMVDHMHIFYITTLNKTNTS